MHLDSLHSTDTPRRAGYQDVLDAPPHVVAQIIDGALHMHARPASPHALAGGRLYAVLASRFGSRSGGSKGWRILYEPELHMGESDVDIIVPDIAGWRRDKIPQYPIAPYFTIAPDWVCEILSPSTRNIDLGSKRDIYARERVSHLWIVDPEAKTLEAYSLTDGEWEPIASFTGDNSVSVQPFEAIDFPLSELWPD